MLRRDSEGRGKQGRPEVNKFCSILGGYLVEGPKTLQTPDIAASQKTNLHLDPNLPRKVTIHSSALFK